jgi:hypothetical protein
MSRIARAFCLAALIVAAALLWSPVAASPGQTSPVAAAPAPTATTSAWHPDVEAARSYAQSRRGSVRFAIITLNGRILKENASRTAPAASVFKVMLLVTYLRMRSVRNRPLERSDRRLLVPMIRKSDDVAATRVRDIVGRARVERLAELAEMRHFTYHDVWGLSRTSPRDQTWFMYRLNRYLPDRHQHFARYQLAHIVDSQRWGVGQVPLNGWHLFFKGGWGTGTGRVDHQVAFLEKGSRRIALAIFTEFNPSHTYGKNTLEGVARRLLRGLPD